MSLPYASARFPTTAWSMVQAAGDRLDPEYVSAVNRFINSYWKPVFYFLRAKGYPLHQAEDLTQEFFLRFLERDWLAQADPERGRFRNFLLKILVRFLSDQRPNRAPRQQGFEQQFTSIQSLLDDADRSYEPSARDTPEDVFMKQWAAALVYGVRRRLQTICDDEGHSVWYEIFEASHFPEPGSSPPSQQELADRLGLTRDQVRYALEQANERFRELLRGEVEEQVGSTAEVGEEIRELMAWLGSD